MNKSLIILFVFVSFSCNSKKSQKDYSATVANFLQSIQSRNFEEASKYLERNTDVYGMERPRDSIFEKTYSLIARFGLPPQKNWDIIYSPETPYPVSIGVPLYNDKSGKDSLMYVGFAFSFAPSKVSNRIFVMTIFENKHPSFILRNSK